jgi:hypothetical protein
MNASLPDAPFTPRFPDGGTVKVVGLGGVGGIVARYAAIFLASLRERARLVLVDGDSFEPENASRMLFSATGNKAEVVRDDLLPHVADSRLSVVAVPEYLAPDNLERILRPGDIVVLAVDNHATRRLVDEFCARSLDDVCLISGGNDGVEGPAAGPRGRGTFGNVQVYLRRGGRDLTPSLGREHPEIATASGGLPGAQNCTAAIVSTPQILFANLMTASAILNALWLHLCGALHYHETVFDIAEARMRPIDGDG